MFTVDVKQQSNSNSLYRAVSQREGERGEKVQMREKMSKQPYPHLLQGPTAIQIVKKQKIVLAS